MAADPEKEITKGGNGQESVQGQSMIAVMERMLAALQEKARPIQEEILVMQQLLQGLRDNQFLEDRRRARAAVRQLERS